MPFCQPQYVQYTYQELTFVFQLTTQGVDSQNSDMACHYLCHAFHILRSNLDSLQRSFLYFCSFAMLRNEQNMATNEAQWPPH